MTEWLSALPRLLDATRPCVLVTVAAVRGSAPREAGAKMLVTQDTIFGTIGGGQLEYQCIQAARDWLRESNDTVRVRRQRITLGASCGQCCGGVVDIVFEDLLPGQRDWAAWMLERHAADEPVVTITAQQNGTLVSKLSACRDDFVDTGLNADSRVRLLARARSTLADTDAPAVTTALLADDPGAPLLIERTPGAGPLVVVFGAGHVGRALARALAPLQMRVVVVDNRADVIAEIADDGFDAAYVERPERFVRSLPGSAWFVVMTHDHGLDLRLCAEILQRDDAAFCGLIGSLSKRRRFEKRLRASGFADTDLARLTCPIGIDTIRGKHPATIALAVAAQLQALRECALPQHKKNEPGLLKTSVRG